MRLLPIVLLAGCASETTRLLDTWVGVYRIDAFRVDEATCGPDGPQTEPPADFLVLDAVSREEPAPDTLNLRLCTGRTSGCAAPWFSFEVDSLAQKAVTGSQLEWVLFPNEVCALRWATATLTRDGDQLHVEIESFSEDLEGVETEEDCLGALEVLEGEAVCEAFHALDVRRLPDP